MHHAVSLYFGKIHRAIICDIRRYYVVVGDNTSMVVLAMVRYAQYTLDANIPDMHHKMKGGT